VYISLLGEVTEFFVRRFLAITRALDDRTRLRTLLALRHGELCLCQLVELLGLAPSTVSKHVNILCAAGLLDRRKEGRWAYFRLAGRNAAPEVRRAIRWVVDCLEHEDVIVDDRRKLGRVMERDLAELCGCYA
jgi:DNA-binding transcriptional ArsR family regulator